MAMKFFHHNIQIEMTEQEVGRLMAIEDPDYEPIDRVLDRIMVEQQNGKFADPLGLGHSQDFLAKPFNFFGGYVALNSDQRMKIKETELATYYKVQCDTLFDARKQLLSEIDALSKDALEANKQKFELNDEVRALKA